MSKFRPGHDVVILEMTEVPPFNRSPLLTRLMTRAEIHNRDPRHTILPQAHNTTSCRLEAGERTQPGTAPDGSNPRPLSPACKPQKHSLQTAQVFIPSSRSTITLNPLTENVERSPSLHSSPPLNSTRKHTMRYTAFPQNTLFVPRILRLQVEIGSMFADNMDLLSLMRWRLTCKTNYEQAASSLRRSLMGMLNRFVPSPVVLLDIITRHRSIFGGGLALAFVLRDTSLLTTSLDIYASDYEFGPLCSSILGEPGIRSITTSHEYRDLGTLNALRTLVSRILIITTSRGIKIRVHRSYTSSATAPISRAPCTALSNFVTQFGFGCSHPVLTLDRRALLTDQELPQIPVNDRDVLDDLMDRGFSLAFGPAAWPEFRRYNPPIGRKDKGKRPDEGDREHASGIHHTTGRSRTENTTRTPSPPHEASSSVAIPSTVAATGSLVILGVDARHLSGSGTSALASLGDDVPPQGPGHLALGESVIAFESSAYNEGGVSPLLPFTTESGMRSDSVLDPDATPLGFGLTGPDPVGLTLDTLQSDTNTILQSIYPMAADVFLTDNLRPLSSPTSGLLSVLDTNHPLDLGYPPAVDGDADPDRDTYTHDSVADIITGSTLPQQSPLLGEPTLLDLLESDSLDTIDPSLVIGPGKYHFAGFDNIGGSHPYTHLEPASGSTAEWSLDLWRFVYTDVNVSNEDCPGSLDFNDIIPQAGTWGSAAHNASDILDYHNPPHTDASTVQHAVSSGNVQGVTRPDIDPATHPDSHYPDDEASRDAASTSRPLVIAMPAPIIADNTTFALYDHPDPLIDPTAALQPPNNTSTQSAIGALTAVEPFASCGPPEVRETPWSVDATAPALTEQRLVSAATVVRSSAPSPTGSVADHTALVADHQQTQQADRELHVNLHAQTPSFSNHEFNPPLDLADATAVDASGVMSADASEGSDSDTDDESDGADTVIDPPPPQECWRHRFVCPSQGRYFGDCGSFVEFFDPLRGGEKYCAQNNIAPFGPMVVWRVLSTFNCEEGCDMYDDVLEEGVTSIPVLIRRDPFGELRDIVSDRAMSRLNKRRSLTP